MTVSDTPLPPLAPFALTDTQRLIAAIHPVSGILDLLVDPNDLQAVLELEQWTDDRVITELGILLRLPRQEWVTGVPHAHVIMSAFTHPAPAGARFNDASRGAWYAAGDLDTAHAESIHRRCQALQEIGAFDTVLRVRAWIADFIGDFHDLTSDRADFAPYYAPDSYHASQRLGRELLAQGSVALVYRSIRRPSGHCIACFRPRAVHHVRPEALYEYVWSGPGDPRIRRIAEA